MASVRRKLNKKCRDNMIKIRRKPGLVRSLNLVMALMGGGGKLDRKSGLIWWRSGEKQGSKIPKPSYGFSEEETTQKVRADMIKMQEKTRLIRSLYLVMTLMRNISNKVSADMIRRKPSYYWKPTKPGHGFICSGSWTKSQCQYDKRWEKTG